MTVLFFCNLNTGKLGAFENLLIEIGRNLAVKGDRLIVIFGATPQGPVPAALKEVGIEWGHIEGWARDDGQVGAWRFVRPALAIIRRYRPDLVAVHFGNELPVLVTSLLCKLMTMRAPLWVWHQRQQIANPGPLTRWLSRIKIMSLGVDHYVAIYEGGRESLIARGIKPDAITRIYNAVPDYVSQRQKGWLRQELNFSPDTVLAVNVGWLVPRKRIGMSINAFAKVARRLPKTALLVVGGGPKRKLLESRVRDLQLESRVRFLGIRNDMRDIMAECDCLVHSACAEACANVVNESMATAATRCNRGKIV